MITKLLYIRLKLFLYRLYTGEMWHAWDVVAADKEEYMKKHKVECEEVIRGIPVKDRELFLQLLKMKAQYLQRESTSRLDKKDRVWTDARLFQTLLLHAQIDIVQKVDQLNRERELLRKEKE